MKSARRYVFKSNDSLLRHFKDTSTLYLEIVDYPGEWLLDLPMLAQDYLSWSRQMTGLLNGQRGEWSAKMANDERRAGPASACRRKPAGGHCRRVDRLSPPL
ncbi:YcjX family protein [Escherichia coli]